MPVRVFNVNKAIGLASSGVEYAQRYRRELLAGIPGVDDRYVFTDYLPTNACRLTDRLGFDRDRVVWIYDVVTGRPTRPCTVGVDEVLATIGQPHAVRQAEPDVTEAALDGSAVRYRIRTVEGGGVDRVETWVRDRMTRVDHYDASLSSVEHVREGRVVRRVFHAPDGRIAAEQSYRDREIARTVITPASPLFGRAMRHGRPSSFRGDILLDGRARFLRFVFEHLLDRPDDVVIVDRALDVIDAIYPVLGERRLYSVVHAEHYDLRQAEDGVLLWNNHYENVFTRPDLVAGLIVSTERQREMLEAQLARRGPEGAIPVIRIPVGYAAEPAAAPEHDPFAIVTASRLADEKRVDLLIRAIAAAGEALPGLRLDVYGEGNRDRLLAVIEETGTADRVRLLGHRDLRGLLGRYALYASASASEGFGLSMLEAMAEGLPIVGFDVDYGNRELVASGVNGRLVPVAGGEGDVAALAEAIVEVLTSGSLAAMREQSLRRANAYTAAHVRELWADLLRAPGTEEEPC